MTRTQFKTKIRIARETGEARMADGSVLINHGGGEWEIRDFDGQTVTVIKNDRPEKLFYIFED